MNCLKGKESSFFSDEKVQTQQKLKQIQPPKIHEASHQNRRPTKITNDKVKEAIKKRKKKKELFSSRAQKINT